MQRYYIHYIYILVFLFLAACSDSASIIEEKPEQRPEGAELTGIKAVIAGSSASTTRSSADEYNTDYVGRSTFINHDEMIITKFQRTTSHIQEYSYTNIFYKANSDLAWERTISDGYENKERIYWSDNASYHTFIGYSLPQAWKNDNGILKSNKWTKTTGTTSPDIYHGQFSRSGENNDFVDFTVKGTYTITPTSSSTNPTITVNGDYENDNNAVIDKTGTRLKNEDLLLFYNTEQLADIGGLTTTLHYRHALASLRVIIDIREFAATDQTKDASTTISNLLVLNQPWKYKWTQSGSNTSEDDTDPGWGVVNDMQTTDQTVTIKAWQPRPQGEGTGSNKTFTFYSLIVPGAQKKAINGTGFDMHYKVTYPNALKPNEMEDHTYGVHMDEIMFKAGYCTTVRVSLNHRGEPINVGATFYNWDDVATPDKSNLQKVSTFLDTSNRADVTIAGDEKATIEDATWLYYEKDAEGNATESLKDIYGNDGTIEKPFTIKTARQLLSLCYEVNAPNTLNESKDSKGNPIRVDGSERSSLSFSGKYVKLEADLFLQPENTESKWTIEWPGIGTADKAFDGYFDGGNRIIKLLKGKPLFTNIGANAHIECLQLGDVIGLNNEGGCLAEVNYGIICGCQVFTNNNREIYRIWGCPNGHKMDNNTGYYCDYVVNTETKEKCNEPRPSSTSTDRYAGLICGKNNGTIFACKAQGDFNSAAQYTGGITGINNGSIVASIAIGKISSSYSGSGEKVFGGISAQNKTSTSVTTCFFDKDKMKDVTYVDLTVCGKSTTEMQKKTVVDALNTKIQNNSDNHFKTRNYTFHVGQYPRLH